MNIILKGVVGSTAYGLDHAGSDMDYLGIFVPPTEEIVGLSPPRESIVTKGPDTSLHEAKKFVTLALNGNPTLSDLLWLDTYEVMTEAGEELINLRRSFLSASRVRDAYLGYAVSQSERLKDRGDGSFSADTRKRTEKHARHLVRLVEQGFQLYVTGELVVNLRSSASSISPDTVRAMSQKISENPLWAQEYMRQAEERFDKARTCLPDQPDREAVNRWLVELRRQSWNT